MGLEGLISAVEKVMEDGTVCPTCYLFQYEKPSTTWDGRMSTSGQGQFLLAAFTCKCPFEKREMYYSFLFFPAIFYLRCVIGFKKNTTRYI